MGSSLRFPSGRGRRSGTCWLVFLLINKVDIGFLRKGKPFFGLGGSGWLAVCDNAGGSLARRVPAGRRPVGPDVAFLSSVGVLNDDVIALEFFNTWGLVGAGSWMGTNGLEVA